jgi:hypothetical protein
VSYEELEAKRFEKLIKEEIRENRREKDTS